MKSHRLAIFALAALAAAGCRTRPEQRAVFDSYQEELRRYEGIIYDLEYRNEILGSENERLTKRLGTTDAGQFERRDTGPGIFGPRRDPERSRSTDSGRPSNDATPDDIDLSPPLIETGPTPDAPPRVPQSRKPIAPDSLIPSVEEVPEQPAIENEPIESIPLEPMLDDDSPDEPPIVPPSVLVPPKKTRPFSQPTSEALPPPKQPTFQEKSPELLPTPEDKKVSQLFIDPRQTRGLDLDRTGGDDGLRVVLEPRNAAGEFVATAGKVSIVLLDPAKTGESARLGRWEFAADMVLYQLRLSGQKNIPLDVPWSGELPKNSRLTMFVRLETDAGDLVEASREVSVVLPDQVSSRWTPRPAQRRGPLTKQVEIARAASQPRPIVATAAHEEEAVDDAEETETASRPEWKPYR